MRVLAGHARAATGRILIGHARYGDGLASYAVDGEPPALVLDFTKQVFASDPSGWAEAYAVGGERPTMLLDFITGEYGA